MTKTTRLSRLLLTALAVGVLALGSACGGKSSGGSSTFNQGGSGSSGESADSAAALDPCSLVPTDQISSIVGETAVQGPTVGENRGRVCHWTIPDGLVAIVTFKGKEFYLAGTLGPALSGIGDEAQATPTGGTILFRKGDNVVSVQVLGGENSRDQAITLAKAAADAI